MYRNISQYSEKISQYIAIPFSCIVTPLVKGHGQDHKIQRFQIYGTCTMYHWKGLVIRNTFKKYESFIS